MTRRASKRTTLKDKYKIQRKIKQHKAKQAKLQGLIVGSRRHQIEMIDAIEATNLKPIIDREFPLSEIAEAFRHQESGKHFGKICLTF